jgi:hypothetical protein
MKRIFVPTTSPPDWKNLLAQKDLHWKPGRSAMSAAACWEEAAVRLPPELAEAFDAAPGPELKKLELLLAIPEWQVHLPGGSRPSQTDVFALARNAHGLVALAVEAKVDETFGPTLKEKRAEASEGQTERLDYLHRVLGLQSPLPDTIRYQLLHRTVSAIETAKAFHASTAVMVVQSFSAEVRWHEDFAEALGAGPIGVGMARALPGHDRPKVFLAWCCGDQRFSAVDLRVAQA